jgi:tetratricopeptide (TPR) repeat protein
MLLILVRRPSLNLLFLTVILSCTASAFAGDDSWLTLKTSRFDIVSELNEKRTRLWAEEFDKYVTALHLLYKTEDKNLLPLTIVLFKNKKQFSPYIIHTESGQAENVVGVFANFDDWGIIGLPGSKDYDETRNNIFHEAMHWYLKSQNFNAPLWLEEGIAEVFSTFKTRNGKGRWGLPIKAHVDYLNYNDLQPTRDFLFVTQDEALHKLDTYYPQAWAMVHYFMFGNGRKNREKFVLFLTALNKKSTKDAFESVFGMTYEEFDTELQTYVHSGKYKIDEMDLTNINTEMKIGPASDDVVKFALGRLAIAGGIPDLGIKHAEAVISSAPSRPEGYELLSMALRDSENQTRLAEALEKAISLNSTDSQIYYMRASMLMEEKWRTGYVMGSPLEEDVAKEIAVLFKKSISFRPNKKDAFEGYVMALMNMDTYKEEDIKILELGKRLYPQEGFVPAGFAALARMDGDINSFNQKIEESCGNSMQMSPNMKMNLRSMQQYTYHEWLFDKIMPLIQENKFGEAELLLTQQNSLSFISTDMHSVLKEIDAILSSSKILYNAELAMRDGRIDEALAILNDIEKDDKIPKQAKAAARRMVSAIENRKKYIDEKAGKP